MKKLFLVFFMALSVGAYAQLNEGDMSRYLAEDAVVLKDGHVVFSEKIDLLDNCTESQIGDIAISWLEGYLGKYDKAKNRIISKEPGKIVAVGDMEIVFTNNALAYDRAQMSYVLVVKYSARECSVSVERIRYVYEEGNKTSRFMAEQYITDEMAVNKKRTKLTPVTGKFRKKTIDAVDEVFESFNAAFKYYTMNGMAEIVKNAPQVMQVQQEAVVPQQKTLKSDDPVITKLLQGKLVQIMDGTDSYMIIFYPAGSSCKMSDATMIIECKKLPDNKLGEVIDVWIK